MTDKEKISHDLALLVVSEIISRDFSIMKNTKESGDMMRDALAASVLEEYNYFFDVFMKSIP